MDPSRIRGLNYYDSVVFETTINFKIKNKQNKLVELGSVASGGSYAKLCSRFKGGANFEGTGCSFGISRLVYLILQLNQLEVPYPAPYPLRLPEEYSRGCWISDIGGYMCQVTNALPHTTDARPVPYSQSGKTMYRLVLNPLSEYQSDPIMLMV